MSTLDLVALVIVVLIVVLAVDAQRGPWGQLGLVAPLALSFRHSSFPPCQPAGGMLEYPHTGRLLAQLVPLVPSGDCLSPGGALFVALVCLSVF